MSLSTVLFCTRKLGSSSYRSAPIRNAATRFIRDSLCRIRSSKQFLRSAGNKGVGSSFRSFSVINFGLVGIKLIQAQEKNNEETTNTNSRILKENSTSSKKLSFPELKPETPDFPWLQFFEYVKPHLHYLFFAVASAIAAAILNIRIPNLLGDVVNVVSNFITEASSSDVSSQNFLRDIRDPVLSLIKLYAAQSLATFAYIYSLACLGERVASTMRRELFMSVVRQDVAFFDERRTGEIVSRLTSDVQEFKSSLKSVVSQGLRSFTQTCGCLISLYLISPEMTGVMVIFVPSMILTGTILGSFLRKLSKHAQAQVAKATSVGEECISNIRTVRAFAMESTEVSLYSKEVEEARRLNERLGFGIGLFQGATNLFLNGIVLGTLSYGGYLMSDRNLTPGQLMSFLVSTQTIQRSITHMSLLFGQFIRGVTSGARVFEYINQQPEIPIEGGKRIPYHNLFGDIEFRNVSFSYPSRPQRNVLRNFSFRIPPGSTVALVGSSGGGKSTLAALLERFYDVNEGQITLDGIDIRELDPKWLRGSAIGFINQEPVLFATSVLENIRYGRPSASDDEVLEAARNAHAHDFITHFPDGYSTILGERGVTVSGGQKQRIAIARALLKNPSILILDEATSALDAESEQIVQEALDVLSKGRTVLIIAHRLSTVQKADVIAVLNKGVLAEIGNHESLKKLGGIYAKLIQQQEFYRSQG